MSNSKQLFDRAVTIIPGGVNSPVRAFNGVGGGPLFIERAQDAYIYDVDKKQYIDYVGSWGPMILGHNHPAIKEAVIKAAENGLSFGAPTEIEIRGYTNRDKILKFEGCYHGHADSLLVKAGSGALTLGQPSSPGIPADFAKHTLTATYNDLDSVKQLFAEYKDQIACIIVEPVAGNMNCILPQEGFLQGLRQICDDHGALLILDEVMTGFRVALGGAQAYYNIKPDLTTLGKVIGGGMPVGAFGGCKKVMQHIAPTGPVYQAGTLSGNPIAMHAGLAALTALDTPEYAQLVAKTEKLALGLKKVASDENVPLAVNYIGGMFGFFFTEEKQVTNFAQVCECDVDKFKKFFHLMLEQGIYLAPSAFEAGFLSLAHTDQDIEDTLAAAKKAFSLL